MRWIWVIVVMVSAVCVRADGELARWARAVILRVDASSLNRPCVELRRQDHGQMQVGKSVLGTPLVIGKQKFEHGLGTHATSEIVVHCDHPMKHFDAQVGVDNNFDTAGVHGSVVFSVEANGNQLYRSKLCKGGDEPVKVSVDVNGAKDLTLRVTDGGDGFAYDQADWCNPSITLADGSRVAVDSLAIVRPAGVLGPGMPFSFVYDGQSSADLLPAWKIERSKDDAKHIERTTYTDPKTGLQVQVELRAFDDADAVDWVIRLTNTGPRDTPMIEQLAGLSATLSSKWNDIVFHHSRGSTSSETDFLPIDEPIAPRAHLTLAPNGGRSSDGNLPFFNIKYGGRGLVCAIGWSGEWQFDLWRDPFNTLTLRAGQQTTHFVLHPGESVRTPRILLAQYEGDASNGSNLLRRILIAHYLPRINGQLVMPPIAQNNWADNQGNNSNEQNQLDLIETSSKGGVEDYWLDAGWFVGGWPYGVGTWDERKDAFPHGLKALSDAAHAHGQKFVLWFEPERVHEGSKIAREHANFLFPKQGADSLYNLADPTARKWLTDLLDSKIKEYGVDVFRNDFNIDPLRFWQSADAKDRQGITENHYIEGLYAMWDELIARNPGLWIDNCASGGRRIDLETVSRSIPLWRSDTECFEEHPTWVQAQTAGLCTYVPLNTTAAWALDPYSIRSGATAGLVLAPIGLNDPPGMKFALQNIKRDRAFWLGDFYALTPVTVDPSHWCGWQLHRAEKNDGMVELFRREKSPYATIAVTLHGIDPKSNYSVSFSHGFSVDETRTMTGRELEDLHVTLDQPGTCVLIRYAKE